MSTAESAIRKAKSLIAASQYGHAQKYLLDFLIDYPGNRRAREVLAEMDQFKRPDNPVYGPAIKGFLKAMEHYNNGRFTFVISIADAMLKDFPADADILNLKGVAQLLSDDSAGGLETLRFAHRYHPNHLDVVMNYANALQTSNEDDQAIEYYNKVIAMQPALPQAHYNLAKSLTMTEKVEEAIEHYKKALMLNPDYEEAWNNMGICLINLGRFEEGEEAYRKAIALSPENYEAIRNLADTKALKAGDPVLDEVNTLLKRTDLSPINEARLHYALAQVANQDGDTPLFMEKLEKANALHRIHHAYDFAESRKKFDRIRQRFDRNEAAVEVKSGDRSCLPIFVLGMPRSGTTLVEQILSNHSDVDGLGELQFMTAIISPDVERDEPHQLTPGAIRDDYLGRVAHRTDSRIFTDKMPLNGLWAGHICLAFPEARIIRMKRDPMAIAWSNYRTWFPARGMAYSNRMEDIGAFMQAYEALLDFFQERFPDQIYTCDYEALTEDPAGETRTMITWLGLNHEDGLVDISTNTRAVRTASVAQVRGEIYKGSSAEWKKYEGYLKPMINALKA